MSVNKIPQNSYKYNMTALTILSLMIYASITNNGSWEWIGTPIRYSFFFIVCCVSDIIVSILLFFWYNYIKERLEERLVLCLVNKRDRIKAWWKSVEHRYEQIKKKESSDSVSGEPKSPIEKASNSGLNACQDEAESGAEEPKQNADKPEDIEEIKLGLEAVSVPEEEPAEQIEESVDNVEKSQGTGVEATKAEGSKQNVEEPEHVEETKQDAVDAPKSNANNDGSVPEGESTEPVDEAVAGDGKSNEIDLDATAEDIDLKNSEDSPTGDNSQKS